MEIKETKHWTVDEIGEAAQKLKKGGLVAFPTETVYGLGANAMNSDAVSGVFDVKGRPHDNPLIVHVNSFEQVKDYVVALHPYAQKLADTYWPGPLTLICQTKTDLFAKEVSAGLPSVSFRMPDNEATLMLLKKAGVPAVGPSANTSGKPSPTTYEHVYHDLQGKIDGILDDGATKIGVESTVIDVSDPEQNPMILRPGAITKEQIQQDLGIEVSYDKHLLETSETPKSPGMKYKHYSPDTKVLMVKKQDWPAAVHWVKENNLCAGVLAGPRICDEVRANTAATFSYSDDSMLAATRGLYAGMRALDEGQLSLDVILVAVLPEEGLGLAYMNRLKKAAAQKYFEA
ncbi:MAG: threonylcarbamoyl-AMP synthase [Tetragenococcus halophilus]|uniref:Threonylcarbamoyl-AMP synthase n=1 Tax=Tetragenococcus halophilus TaxID=51669 RepID=A0A3G5FGL4_TETHA|nr:L-threonylcarbamoyladenylate synthase [Tetragenococcus halophilus]AYW49449.1 threonylcarbamoyl-AMP synthase [Tetragenococcus halophilus]MCF1601812.1 threonylcarbamoyl-AMP synthase [Tetragenococcus halophilus]MCF1675760.1 threonylcarbamoyl-AMP synthase [Tetragenococcus halophilus]MDN5831186.1 threonylcarbamoyl-AMP synthase [Tetragenococcus halophilus]MDN6112288.1 threonylcarbamoyl-AMP synthase [Tetragenococcus halophilus]